MGDFFAECERFFHIRDTKKLNLAGEGFSHSRHPVAVAVRFHYCEDLGVADPFTRDPGIVTERGAINFNPATIGLRHRFGIVMCGSRRYKGSSGGSLKFLCWTVTTCAKSLAEG